MIARRGGKVNIFSGNFWGVLRAGYVFRCATCARFFVFNGGRVAMNAVFAPRRARGRIAETGGCRNKTPPEKADGASENPKSFVEHDFFAVEHFRQKKCQKGRGDEVDDDRDQHRDGRGEEGKDAAHRPGAVVQRNQIP